MASALLHSSVCDLFGGVHAVKKRLVNTLSVCRVQQRVSVESLDSHCGFAPRSWRDFEKDPSILSADTFSVASQILDIDLSSIFAEDLKELPTARKRDILSKANGFQAEYASGLPDSLIESDFANEQEMNVLLLLDLVEELG